MSFIYTSMALAGNSALTFASQNPGLAGAAVQTAVSLAAFAGTELVRKHLMKPMLTSNNPLMPGALIFSRMASIMTANGCGAIANALLTPIIAGREISLLRLIPSMVGTGTALTIPQMLYSVYTKSGLRATFCDNS